MSPEGKDLVEMTAAAAAAAIREGRISSEELVRACLERIDEVEPIVQAWAFLDPEHALAQARAADEMRKVGRPLGPLHGVPVGIKDIFDTHDMPTEDGTVLHAGRQPHFDSHVVARLREAGAIIMGKTVTTELAVYTPGKTRNPHNPEHTPGGSSSGSAAAVAAHMVPLAIGSQTNGSVIRPAAYCGVWGYKPTHGLISRTGVLHQSYLLDHVGVFARTAEDTALVATCIMGFDANDRDMRPRAAPPLVNAVASGPPLPPNFAFVRTPVWDKIEPDAEAAFAELIELLGPQAREMPLPSEFDAALDLHRTIHEADLAVSFAPEYERGRDKLSPRLVEMIERGQRIPASAYIRAVERIPLLNAALGSIFEWADVILTPATAGEAPRGLESTGSPAFCTIWTLLGMPAVTVPILEGSRGLPMGVQLVAPRHDDARLLAVAKWLENRVRDAGNR